MSYISYIFGQDSIGLLQFLDLTYEEALASWSSLTNLASIETPFPKKQSMWDKKKYLIKT